MERAAERTPLVRPYLAFVKSIEISSEGAAAKATATLEAQSPAALLVPFFGYRVSVETAR